MSADDRRAIKVIEESPLFAADWYAAAYADAAGSGLSPSEHYFRIGAPMGYDPSPEFSTTGYLQKYPDVAQAQMNALYHYECHGRREERSPVPAQKLRATPETDLLASLIDPKRKPLSDAKAREHLSLVFGQKLQGAPRRLYSSFDIEAARNFVNALTSLPNEVEAARGHKASVIMPTYNRADKIERAIRSVLGQSHQNLELIIIDDGSSDHTSEILRKYSADPRLIPIFAKHEGVSAARNKGLEKATGEIIFYLDSDNLWNRDFLQLMLIGLEVSRADCGYAASRLQDAQGKIIGYRGEPFDRQACTDGNYVDMNVFCHRRDLIEKFGGFDTGLQRMVDWDLILRYTKEKAPLYFPIIGCIYLDDLTDKKRITTSQPYIFRKITHEKNVRGLSSSAEVIKDMSFNISLKVSAVYEDREESQDCEFAHSLKTALMALGHNVRIDYYGTWYDHPPHVDDVVIALRGEHEYNARPDQLSLIWNINSPDQVGYSEYQAYHGVFIASQSYAELLSNILGREVLPLLPCVDQDLFEFTPHARKPQDKAVIIANRKSDLSPIINWMIESKLPLSIYGKEWESYVPSEMIKGQNIEKAKLKKTYSKASFVLLDQSASGKDYGFMPHSAFDVLASGGRLMSETPIPLNGIIDDTNVLISDRDSFEKFIESDASTSAKKRKAVSKFLLEHHSFDSRARTLSNWIKRYLSGKNPEDKNFLSAPDNISGTNTLRRVGLLLQRENSYPTSSAFIRLIAPLSTPSVNEDIEIVYLDGVDDPRIDALDSCIVQGIAVQTMTEAHRLIDRLGKLKIPLIVDNDEAFFLIPDQIDHDRNLRHLMAAACEVWFSTDDLASYYDDIKIKRRIIPNALDPRFWRDYRKNDKLAPSSLLTRFIYMGESADDRDFQMVLPAFEKLAKKMPDRFTLTVIGGSHQYKQTSWFRHLSVSPEQMRYPMLAQWFRENSAFDVGISPLKISQFNRAKSDIKFLNYSATGLLSLVSECATYHGALQRNLAIGSPNTADIWYDRMMDIIEEPEKYEEMRQRASEYLWNERSTLVDANPIGRILYDLKNVNP